MRESAAPTRGVSEGHTNPLADASGYCAAGWRTPPTANRNGYATMPAVAKEDTSWFTCAFRRLAGAEQADEAHLVRWKRFFKLPRDQHGHALEIGALLLGLHLERQLPLRQQVVGQLLLLDPRFGQVRPRQGPGGLELVRRPFQRALAGGIAGDLLHAPRLDLGDAHRHHAENAQGRHHFDDGECGVRATKPCFSVRRWHWGPTQCHRRTLKHGLVARTPHSPSSRWWRP